MSKDIQTLLTQSQTREYALIFDFRLGDYSNYVEAKAFAEKLLDNLENDQSVWSNSARLIKESVAKKGK
jgi:hypothetical protein